MFNRDITVKNNISLFVLVWFLGTVHLLVKESISLKGAKSSFNINSLIGKLSIQWPHRKTHRFLANQNDA